MAIRKQNRTIWVLAAVILLMLVIFLVRDGKLADVFDSSDKNPAEVLPANEEQFGDRVVGETTVKLEEQRKFQETLNRLAQCFQVSGGNLPEDSPVHIETLVQKFQADFGPVTSQADRWVTWHLRTRDGKERRLRLEITESDEGKVGRELHFFAVDREGQPTPIEIEGDKARNPSDEVISQMLKEGEVFTKESAAVSFFKNNERVEYIEKDGELSEIEFFRGDHRFRCFNVKFPDNCQCL